MDQHPPSNPNQPPQGQPSPFWGNNPPPQRQPFNPQYPSGQFPPIPQQQRQYPQYGNYPPQGYQQHLQGFPQQQPPMMQPPTPPKKKAWYKRPWGIALIIFLSLGVCGGIGNAFSAGSNKGTVTTTDSVSQAATTAPTQAVRKAEPTATPTQKPKPTPTPNPTQSPTQIETAYKAKTTDTTVSNLDKQGDAQQGQDVHFTGRIVNFVKDSSGTTAGANIDDPNNSTTSVVQIVLPPGIDLTQVNQSDTIDVWGTDGGTVSGTNAFGATIQEVQITANYMTDQTTNYQA